MRPECSGQTWPIPWLLTTWALLQYRGTVFPCIGISIEKIRRSWDRLIFIISIPIPIRRHLYIEVAPGWLHWQFISNHNLLTMLIRPHGGINVMIIWMNAELLSIPTFGNRCLSAIGGGKQRSRLAGWVQLSAEAAPGPHGVPPSSLGRWEYRWCGKFTRIAAL